MVLATRSGQGIVNSYLVAIGLNAATATEAQRATALAELNDAYRTMLRGSHQDVRGVDVTHLFSFLHPKRSDLAVAAQGKAYLTVQGITFTAVAAGTAGNAVTVTIVDPGEAHALEYSEVGNAATITLEYADGAVVSTTAEVAGACSTSTILTAAGGTAAVAAAVAETYLSLAIEGTDLPSDFGGLVESPQFKYDGADSKAGLPIKYVAPEEMDKLIRDWDGVSDDPLCWTIRPKALSATTGSKYELVFYPPPAAALTVALRYRVDPPDLTDSSAAYAVGNMGVEQLILAIAKAEHELKEGQVSGPERDRMVKLFRQLVSEDRAFYRTQTQQDSMAEEDNGMD